jgi:hypothetical protein
MSASAALFVGLALGFGLGACFAHLIHVCWFPD